MKILKRGQLAGIPKELAGATILDVKPEQEPKPSEGAKRARAVFRPAHNWIEVEKVKAGDVKSPGGIVLASADANRVECRVIAVGPGMLTADGQRQAMSCAPGDLILSANVFDVTYADGYTHFMTRDHDVIAVIEPPQVDKAELQ